MMSPDAKNSVLLWVQVLAFAGLAWAGIHFHVGVHIPDAWFWASVGMMIVVGDLKAGRDFLRKRKATPSSQP